MLVVVVRCCCSVFVCGVLSVGACGLLFVVCLGCIVFSVCCDCSCSLVVGCCLM